MRPSDQRRVLRHNVLVDYQWHRVEHDGGIVHVDARGPDVVEFWAVPAPGLPASPQVWEYRVFATGDVVEGDHVGTVLTLGGALVWHLFRRLAL